MSEKIYGATVGTSMQPQKVIEKAGISKKFDDTLEAIEESLDVIINIQNELIGGDE